MSESNNISFEMDSFNRNKILKGSAAIAEKIYYIFNAKKSQLPNMGELPELLLNFKQRYIDKAEIENKLTVALNEFLDPEIVVSAVVYQEKSRILAVFIEGFDEPVATFRAEENIGLTRLGL